MRSLIRLRCGATASLLAAATLSYGTAMAQEPGDA